MFLPTRPLKSPPLCLQMVSILVSLVVVGVSTTTLPLAPPTVPSNKRAPSLTTTWNASYTETAATATTVTMFTNQKRPSSVATPNHLIKHGLSNPPGIRASANHVSARARNLTKSDHASTATPSNRIMMRSIDGESCNIDAECEGENKFCDPALGMVCISCL